MIDDKYLVDDILGEGGMGCVARGVHLKRRAEVALKFMAPALALNPEAVERFLTEAVAASQIKSDHVVTIFDVGTLPIGAPYIVMELLDGRDLGAVLRQDGRDGLPVARSVYFALQILRALQAAHASGIIHRDIKPSNCFAIERDGEPDFVKLLDFGISKVYSTAGGKELTRGDVQLGSPSYMAPEQAKSSKHVDHRADLYCAGVVLFKLLSGQLPFLHDADAEVIEILSRKLIEKPRRLDDVRPGTSRSLADVIDRVLSLQPEERFQTAAEFAEALAPFADARSARTLAAIRRFRDQGEPAKRIDVAELLNGPSRAYEGTANSETIDVFGPESIAQGPTKLEGSASREHRSAHSENPKAERSIGTQASVVVYQKAASVTPTPAPRRIRQHLLLGGAIAAAALAGTIALVSRGPHATTTANASELRPVPAAESLPRPPEFGTHVDVAPQGNPPTANSADVVDPLRGTPVTAGSTAKGPDRATTPTAATTRTPTTSPAKGSGVRTPPRKGSLDMRPVD
ncbi:MAG: serine/threonine-protein kinase [Polyangiaceae bacterium]